MKLRYIALHFFAIAAAFSQTGRCWDANPNGSYPLGTYGESIEKIRQGDRAEITILTKVNENLRCFIRFADSDRSLIKAVIRHFEQTRTDKQSGASVTGQGSTSLVARGATAKAIGFAAEYGALTESVKGQVVTVTGNLGGFPTALAQEDILPYCSSTQLNSGGSCIGSGALRALRRVSFGVSFDASRNTQTASVTAAPAPASTSPAAPVPVAFGANRHELSSITGRVALIDHRDAASAAYQSKWLAAIKQSDEYGRAVSAILTGMDSTIGPLLSTQSYLNWKQIAVLRLTQAADANQSHAEFETLWIELLSQLLATLRTASPEFESRLADFHAAVQRFDVISDELVDEIASKPLLTLEYQNTRPLAQTPVSTFRIIGDFGWRKNNNLTFNFAAAVFDSLQPPIPGHSNSRLRDIEFGAQYERKLGQLAFLGTAALNFSGYFQNQRTANLLTVDPSQPLPNIVFTNLPSGAKAVFAEPGNIGIGQIKLLLGPDKSSIRIPLAVSFSNRTELIDKPTWRAQVGISYDFDALFSK